MMRRGLLRGPYPIARSRRYYHSARCTPSAVPCRSGKNLLRESEGYPDRSSGKNHRSSGKNYRSSGKNESLLRQEPSLLRQEQGSEV